LDVTIDFEHPSVGRQQLSLSVSPQTFVSDLSWARTFGFERLVPALRRMGLVRGGSLENALVFGEAGPLNVGGLRAGDEPVRHKMLDALGDLALIGHPVCGRLTTERPGHGITFQLVEALLAQKDSWKIR
jgi:UDP-3-O-[3-hydroxymyristoyl] N-acetylglucosamine deacetylase